MDGLVNPELRSQLAEFASADKDAHAFFEYAASRERNRTETPVARILSKLEESGQDVPKPALIRVLRKLEELECGRYVEGRHGYESRFAWTVNITDVGRAALGEQAAVVLQSHAVPVASGNSTFSHVYNLRADFQADFDLPADLTPREAERLATFIRSLPIEGEQ